jgi:hypothetical protein
MRQKIIVFFCFLATFLFSSDVFEPVVISLRIFGCLFRCLSGIAFTAQIIVVEFFFGSSRERFICPAKKNTRLSEGWLWVSLCRGGGVVICGARVVQSFGGVAFVVSIIWRRCLFGGIVCALQSCRGIVFAGPSLLLEED